MGKTIQVGGLLVSDRTEQSSGRVTIGVSISLLVVGYIMYQVPDCFNREFNAMENWVPAVAFVSIMVAEKMGTGYAVPYRPVLEVDGGQFDTGIDTDIFALGRSRSDWLLTYCRSTLSACWFHGELMYRRQHCSQLTVFSGSIS